MSIYNVLVEYDPLGIADSEDIDYGELSEALENMIYSGVFVDSETLINLFSDFYDIVFDICDVSVILDVIYELGM